MKSQMVFFDTLENSKRGTARAAVILPFLLLFSAIWYLAIMKKFYMKHIDDTSMFRKIVAVCVIAFMLISALGVHNPNTFKKALFFGGLIGFVIYGCWNSVLYMTNTKWTIWISIIDILWGTISTAILGFILYFFVRNFGGLQPV